MADKPSKALVLYGDGLARFVDSSHTHLHSVAAKSVCGFLSLPNAPPTEREDDRIVRELAVLLDACQAYFNKTGEHSTKPVPSISDRFMGMKAALISTNSKLKSFGEKLGLTTIQLNELTKTGNSVAELGNDRVASELLKLLGFEGGAMVEASPFELVLVHVGAGEKINTGKDNAIARDLDFVNSLVGSIMQIAQPGSVVGSRLHLSVVLSYGSVSVADEQNLSVLISQDKKDLDPSALFPRQSYTMKGENPRSDIRHHGPMLISQWQDAVTRKDIAESFSFKEFKERGANLVIPADRFLHEVAFKLWKAPKYGA